MAQALALNSQGLALIGQKHFDEAERPLRAALALCEGPLQGEYLCVSGVASNLASVAEARGDLPGAERQLTHALEVVRAAKGDQDPQYGLIILKLGRILLSEGKRVPAQAALESAVRIKGRLGNARDFAIGAMDLAQAYKAAGALSQAEAVLRTVLPVCPKAWPTCEGTANGRLGETLYAEGRLPESEAALRKAADLLGAGGDVVGRNAALSTLADDLMIFGRLREAEPLLLSIHAAQLSGASETAGNIANTEARLAVIYANTQRPEDAAAQLRLATPRLTGPGVSVSDIGVVSMRMGLAEAALIHFPAAKALLEKSIATAQPPPGAFWWRGQAEQALADIAYYEHRFSDSQAMSIKAADDLFAIGDYHRRMVSLNNAAAALIDMGRRDDAEARLNDLLAQARAMPGGEAHVASVEANLARIANEKRRWSQAETLAADALAKHQPGAEGPDFGATGLMQQLGVAEMGLGKHREAEGHLRAALALADRPGANRGAVMTTRTSLCEVLADEGRYEELMACAQALVAQGDSWSDTPASSRNVAYATLGNAYFLASRYSEALEAYQKALTFAGDDPHYFSGTWMSIGQAYAALGAPLKARAALTRARAGFSELGAEFEIDRRESGRRLGDADVQLADLRAAEPLIRDSAAWFEANLGPQHPRTALQWRSLGLALSAAGRSTEALPIFQKVLAVRQGQAAPNLSQVAQSQGDLARCEAALGHYDAARTLYLASEATEAAALGKDHWWVGEAARELGEMEFQAGRYAEAAAAYARAAPLVEKGGKPAAMAQLRLWSAMAVLAHAEGRDGDAQALVGKALGLAAQTFGADDPRSIGLLETDLSFEVDAIRPAAAAAKLSQVLALARRTYGDTSPRLLGLRLQSVRLLRQSGRQDEAETELKALIALQRDAAGLDDPSALWLLFEVVQQALARDDVDEAAKDADQAMALARSGWGEQSALALHAQLVVTDVARRHKRFTDAQAAAEAGVRAAIGLYGPDSFDEFSFRYQLAAIERDSGHLDKAANLLAELDASALKRVPANHPYHAYLANDLAQVLLLDHKPARAQTLLRAAMAKLGPGRSAEVAGAFLQWTLADALLAQGDSVGAAQASARSTDMLGERRAPPITGIDASPLGGPPPWSHPE